jgi:hypothetical protein
MNISPDRLLGAHGARLDHIEERLAGIEQKMDTLIEFTSRFKGGWAVVLIIAGLAGFAANFISTRLFGRGS